MARATAPKPRWVHECTILPDGQYQIKLMEWKPFQNRYDDLAVITGSTKEDCEKKYNEWYRNYCIIKGMNPDAEPFAGERKDEVFYK